MILMLQIFNVIANENTCYKRNELEYNIDKLSEYITYCSDHVILLCHQMICHHHDVIKVLIKPQHLEEPT